MTTMTTTPATTCGDCYMYAHYGDETFGDDTTPDMRRDIVGAFDKLGDAIIGDAHNDDCRSDTGDCTCYETHFSWAPCDLCGSTLGGDRHDVTIVSKHGG